MTIPGQRSSGWSRSISLREGGIQMNQVIDTSTIPRDMPVQSPVSSKFQFRHFVAPTDFSPNSDKAVDYAVQLARRLGAKLTLLHVVPEPSALDYSIEGISLKEIEGWE